MDNSKVENYNDENIEQKLLAETKFSLPRLSLLLDYSGKNHLFLRNNPDLFKKAINNALNHRQIHNNLSEVNKVKTQILQFFTNSIDYKDEYNNDWLTFSINEYFKLEQPITKQFYATLNRFADKITQLDFNNYPMSEEVKQISQGNAGFEIIEPKTFYCKLDVGKLAYKMGYEQLSLYVNMRTCLDFLKILIDEDKSVSYRSNFTESDNRVFSIVVLHHSLDLQEKLPKFINYICHNIDHNIELKTENMKNIYLKFELENSMPSNENLIKKPMKL